MVQRPTPDGGSRPGTLREAPSPRPASVLTPGQKKRRAADAKGKRLELAIKAHLEAEGWLVETAPKVTVWIWNPKLGAKVPISTRHDFFGVWDGVAVRQDARRFYQVTTVNNVAHKRRKIQLSYFPTRAADRIYAYVGRPKRWRVFTGPDFAMPGQPFVCSVPKNIRRAERAEGDPADDHVSVLRPAQRHVRRPRAVHPVQGVSRSDRGGLEVAHA